VSDDRGEQQPVVEEGAGDIETCAEKGEQGSVAAESQAGEAAEEVVAADETAAQLVALTEQLAAAQEQQLRTQAEMQNLRRRAERDVESAHKFGLEKLVNALLPVLDNLDRAISAVDMAAVEEGGAVKALLEGVALTQKSALDALGNFSVAVLDPQGEPFDPEFHQAITMVASDTAEPNSVIEVLQKGYTLNGRLLRAAMVVVAKAE